MKKLIMAQQFYKLTIQFESDEPDQVYKIAHGTNLLNLLIQLNIEIGHSCGRMATCGTCRIICYQGLSKPNLLEKEFKKERQLKPEERLSCQSSILNNTTVIIPRQSLSIE